MPLALPGCPRRVGPIHACDQDRHPRQESSAFMSVSRREVITVSLVLLSAPLLVFGQTCRNGYINFDDPGFVENNPYVLTGLSRENVSWALTTFHAANWHPLTWLSLQLDAQVFGPRPW